MIFGGAAFAGPEVIDAKPSFSHPPRVAYKAGWQSNFVYNVPPGVAGVFFHYPCPTSGLNVPVSGTFSVNATGEPNLQFLGNGRRVDTNFNEWFWRINWAGNAPAGVQVTFNVYCANR